MRIGGLSEVAKELGVSRQRAAQLRQKPEFPRPIGEIAAGSIWDLDVVRAWTDSDLRRRGGRPSASERVVILGSRYRLEDPPIGSGGFADVYRALDLDAAQDSYHRVVAVKVLRASEDPEHGKRFKRELRIISQLEHENVVPVHDYGELEDGQLWYAMPLAKGSLAEKIDDLFGDESRMLEVLRQVCDGLAYVHASGVHHRDLKPANILWIRSDSWALSDFGLACEAERRTTALTTTHQGLGTFFYAAPEVWTKARSADGRADIFALGKILQELVTGELPVGNEVPRNRYRRVIQKATRQSPDQRFQSVPEFLSAVEEVARAPRGRWEAVPEAVQRLTDRVRGDNPDDAALAQLLNLATEDDSDHRILELSSIIPLLSKQAIVKLWNRDREAFRSMTERYAEYASSMSWDFAYCDVIADFLERAVEETADEDVMTHALASLIGFGYSHRRWHVQDVVVRLLQRVREEEDALAAVSVVREANPEAVRWMISDFAARSLHPVLRSFLEELFRPDALHQEVEVASW